MSPEAPAEEATGPIRIPAGAHDGRAHVPAAEAAAAAAAAAPTPERVADAIDGSIAARLRAKHAEIQQGTRQFDVPGWDGDLVVVARVVRDRKQLAAGMTNEQLVVEATSQVLYRDDAGGMQDIGGWAGVGQAMGLESVTLGQIVRAVLDNPLRLDGFAESIISWMMGRQSAVEAVLGK
jgi:hypothetical protein